MGRHNAPMIFISYAREDQPAVSRIYRELYAKGFTPWMDRFDIFAGEVWKESIENALRRSDFVLVCLSKRSVGKRGVLQREIRDALDMWQERLAGDIFLIPVRLEPCEAPEKLRDFQWVDIFEEDGFYRLLKSLRAGIRRRNGTDGVEYRESTDNATARKSDAIGSPPPLSEPRAPRKPVERLQIDPRTGLPPEEHTLKEEAARLRKIEAAAKRVTTLLAEAEEQTPWRARLTDPARILRETAKAREKLDILSDYRRHLNGVFQAIEQDDWNTASEQLRRFFQDHELTDTMMDDCSRLLGAVGTGAEAQAVLKTHELNDGRKLAHLREKDLSHPILAPIRRIYLEMDEEQHGSHQVRYTRLKKEAESMACGRRGPNQPSNISSWLTTPILMDSSRISYLEQFTKKRTLPANTKSLTKLTEELLNAAGPNRTALLAAIGDVEEVSAYLRTDPSLLPHNLAVAGFLRLNHLGARTDRETIARTLAICSLLACCTKYRSAIAQQYAYPMPAALRQDDAQVKLSIRAAIERHLGQAGIEWGELDEPQSWACHWEAECLAVGWLQISATDSRLPWPYGPTLIDFYGLEDELGRMLENHPKLRTWYGPCAAAKSMLYSEKPLKAVASLRHVEADVSKLASEAPGYRRLPNPARSLQRDLNRVRSDICFHLLHRDQIGTDTSQDEAAQLTRKWIEYSQELLRLRSLEGDIMERLTRDLILMFRSMVEHVTKAKMHLGRPATVEDAQLRRKCMDTLVEYLEKRKDKSRLTALIGGLRVIRAELLVELSELVFDEWGRRGQPHEMVNQIVELTDQAVKDAPDFAKVNIAKAHALLLREQHTGRDMYRGETASFLASLSVKAAAYQFGEWPPEAINELKNLQLMVRMDNYQSWAQRWKARRMCD